jgi:hypothetical protein
VVEGMSFFSTKKHKTHSRFLESCALGTALLEATVMSSTRPASLSLMSFGAWMKGGGGKVNLAKDVRSRSVGGGSERVERITIAHVHGRFFCTLRSCASLMYMFSGRCISYFFVRE